jgi:hypothetical protein
MDLDYDAESETSPEMTYYTIFCNEGACDACRELDRVEFTPEHLPEYRPPIKTCKNPVCWCGVSGVSGGSDAPLWLVETVDVLRRFGGRSNDPRAVAYFEAQKAAQAQKREREEREREASRMRLEANLRRQNFEGAALQKSREARVFEKDDPDQAVLLYREVVGIYENIATSFSVPPAWPRLDHVYDRLTVLLSRVRREEEALAEIARYRAFGRGSQPACATWNAILSREARIKKRLARENPETDAGTGLR